MLTRRSLGTSHLGAAAGKVHTDALSTSSTASDSEPPIVKFTPINRPFNKVQTTKPKRATGPAIRGKKLTPRSNFFGEPVTSRKIVEDGRSSASMDLFSIPEKKEKDVIPIDTSATSSRVSLQQANEKSLDDYIKSGGFNNSEDMLETIEDMDITASTDPVTTPEKNTDKVDAYPTPPSTGLQSVVRGNYFAQHVTNYFAQLMSGELGDDGEVLPTLRGGDSYAEDPFADETTPSKPKRRFTAHVTPQATHEYQSSAETRYLTYLQKVIMAKRAAEVRPEDGEEVSGSDAETSSSESQPDQDNVDHQQSAVDGDPGYAADAERTRSHSVEPQSAGRGRAERVVGLTSHRSKSKPDQQAAPSLQQLRHGRTKNAKALAKEPRPSNQLSDTEAPSPRHRTQGEAKREQASQEAEKELEKDHCEAEHSTAGPKHAKTGFFRRFSKPKKQVIAVKTTRSKNTARQATLHASASKEVAEVKEWVGKKKRRLMRGTRERHARKEALNWKGEEMRLKAGQGYVQLELGGKGEDMRSRPGQASEVNWKGHDMKLKPGQAFVVIPRA